MMANDADSQNPFQREILTIAQVTMQSSLLYCYQVYKVLYAADCCCRGMRKLIIFSPVHPFLALSSCKALWCTQSGEKQVLETRSLLPIWGTCNNTLIILILYRIRTVNKHTILQYKVTGNAAIVSFNREVYYINRLSLVSRMHYNRSDKSNRRQSENVYFSNWSTSRI